MKQSHWSDHVTLSPPTRNGSADHASAFTLRCTTCQCPFDFGIGESAVVLRHVAYGYDFVHDGACLAAATQLMFVEPGYDCAAFGPDVERKRVLAVVDAEGWAAILSDTSGRRYPGNALRFEPLWCWARVEYRDGSQRLEGIVGDSAWLEEAGGAEFPESLRSQACLGYVSPAQRALQDLEHVSPSKRSLVPVRPTVVVDRLITRGTYSHVGLSRSDDARGAAPRLPSERS
jgi:hypothetical protein